MTMETKNYVPLVIAKRLKEKGYHGKIEYAANEMAWPTYEQAVGWIDRKSGMLIYTIMMCGEKPDKPKYYGTISPSRGDSSIVTSGEPTKEQALNIAIIKALEKIV